MICKIKGYVISILDDLWPNEFVLSCLVLTSKCLTSQEMTSNFRLGRVNDVTELNPSVSKQETQRSHVCAFFTGSSSWVAGNTLGHEYIHLLSQTPFLSYPNASERQTKKSENHNCPSHLCHPQFLEYHFLWLSRKNHLIEISPIHSTHLLLDRFVCVTLIAAKGQRWEKPISNIEINPTSQCRDYTRTNFIVCHQTFPEAISNFPDFGPTLSLQLNQCWGYNRDAERAHKARASLQTVLQATFCLAHTLYAANLFPSPSQFAVLAWMQA